MSTETEERAILSKPRCFPKTPIKDLSEWELCLAAIGDADLSSGAPDRIITAALEDLMLHAESVERALQGDDEWDHVGCTLGRAVRRVRIALELAGRRRDAERQAAEAMPDLPDEAIEEKEGA